MPDLPADLPPHTTVGQSRNGRWWSQCTRQPCDHYTSGLLTRDAAIGCGRVHQAQHDGYRPPARTGGLPAHDGATRRA